LKVIPKLEFEWDEEKSKQVKRKHGKSLREILDYILTGKVVAFEKHFNQERYPGQLSWIWAAIPG